MWPKREPVRIAVVGSGYVGLVASACFAEIGHQVTCVDNDESKVRSLQEGGVPIHEEHLPELLARHRGRSLEFTSDLRAATQSARLSSSQWERRKVRQAAPISPSWTRWPARSRARSTPTR